MAFGVDCPAGYDLNGSGYVYLEVTDGSFGETVPDEIRLAAPPLVVPIGDVRACTAPLPRPRPSHRLGG